MTGILTDKDTSNKEVYYLMVTPDRKKQIYLQFPRPKKNEVMKNLIQSIPLVSVLEIEYDEFLDKKTKTHKYIIRSLKLIKDAIN